MVENIDFFFNSDFVFCRCNELKDDTTKKIMDLVFELLCQGDLMLAKVLRKKIIEKCESKQGIADIFPSMTIMSSISLQTR